MVSNETYHLHEELNCGLANETTREVDNELIGRRAIDRANNRDTRESAFTTNVKGETASTLITTIENNSSE